jgi:polar amino acid transport system substrate-binding protein
MSLKRVLSLAVLSTLVIGCGVQEYRPNTPSVYLSAQGCVQSNQDNLYTTGGYAIRYLTIATGDPTVPPWWEGGTTALHSEWTPNDPYLGQGFEGAMAFEIAERFGFDAEDVRFVPVGFRESFAPGDKDFDFALQQVAILPDRMKGVEVSDGYYDVSQGLLSVQGSPIAHATSLDALKDASLGAPIDTASLRYLEETLQPSTEPTVYEDLGAAVRGLTNAEVDGIVVDLPTASHIAEEQVPNGVLVGRLPDAGSHDHFAMTFEKGSPIVQCVDLALQEMRADGTLDELRQEWLGDTSSAPLIEG